MLQQRRNIYRRCLSNLQPSLMFSVTHLLLKLTQHDVWFTLCDLLELKVTMLQAVCGNGEGLTAGVTSKILFISCTCLWKSSTLGLLVPLKFHWLTMLTKGAQSWLACNSSTFRTSVNISAEYQALPDHDSMKNLQTLEITRESSRIKSLEIQTIFSHSDFA